MAEKMYPPAASTEEILGVQPSTPARTDTYKIAVVCAVAASWGVVLFFFSGLLLAAGFTVMYAFAAMVFNDTFTVAPSEIVVTFGEWTVIIYGGVPIGILLFVSGVILIVCNGYANKRR